MKSSRNPKPRVQSLARADLILSVISSSSSGHARLTDIASQLKMHKTTAYSLIETLMALGYVRRISNSKEYALGHRLFDLARMSEASFDILAAARPVMRRISGIVNESICLGIPSKSDVLVVNTIEGSHSVRGARYQGHHSPFHASALGKAMLAFMPDAEKAAILALSNMPRLTPKTLRGRKDLAHELLQITRLGYATSLEEEELGANAVAAPVLNRLGDVLGAIAIWGPAPRLTPHLIKRLGEALVKETRSIFAPIED